MDPYTTITPVTDVVDVTPNPAGSGWHRAWVVILIVLKFGIPVIAAGLGIYLLYRWLTKGKRNGTARVAKVATIADTLKAMTPEERLAYMNQIISRT